MSMKNSFHIDFIEQLQGGMLHIEGYVIGDTDKVMARTVSGDVSFAPNGAKHTHETPQKDMMQVDVLSADIVVGTIDRLEFLDSTLRPMYIYANRYSGLGNLTGSYMKKNKRLYRKGRRAIVVRDGTKFRTALYEILFLLRIIGHWRLTSARYALYGKGRVANRISKSILILGEAVVTIPYALLLRITARIYKAHKKHPIWLVSDRGAAAGDSGEAFFRHISKQHSNDDYDIYFVLSKHSSDKSRIEQVGPVLDPGSFAYKLKFLLADKVISSHADVEVTNPFLRHIDRYVDHYRFDFVFLQHGIIRNDLSGWLNRYEKNISLFVTSAQREYDSLLKYPYYYRPENILLSGLPRYDLLENNPHKKLILAPTYRKGLLRLRTNQYGARGYDNEFKTSEYFLFYNRLLTDKRLHVAMKTAGMTGEFYLHPNFAAQRRDFAKNNYITIPNYPYDYKRAFAEGTLLVSDYSSVVFDFAYLKKPILYTHFDVETFFEGHTYTRGDFFSDEADGFGPVTYTYDDLVTQIIASIKDGCKMNKEYEERVDNFFKWHDRQNSERVYQAITRQQKEA